MNRETEKHFSELPETHIPRSKFYMPSGYRSTWDTGEIIVNYLEQNVLPGDTIKMDMSMVVRMATPLYPVLDNAWIDQMFFFIPYRLVWDHWREFWGENKSEWYQQIEYEIPQVITREKEEGEDEDLVFTSKSVADYMGLPLDTTGLSVSALPFRALCKVWNDWFRDENLQQEIPFSTGDTTLEAGTATQTGGEVPKANRFHDYFSSALNSPQKGPAVLLPLGQWAPVRTRSEGYEGGLDHPSLMWGSNTAIQSGRGTIQKIVRYGTEEEKLGFAAMTPGETSNSTVDATVYPANLWTDLTNATAASINDLRMAIAIQHFYEAQARGGSRYIEFIRNIFGVTSPDARLQRSEYLGGRRIPVSMTQVTQTSATSETSPLGQTGAYSQTNDQHDYFTKSFTEHGILLGICVIRTDHSFDQGIERAWSRKKWVDFFVPQLQNISEMGIKNKEIFAQGTDEDEEIFGYQEPWADYKYKPSKNTGAFRTTYAQSLDAWHYGDHYETLPVLGATWIQEPTENVDRTLAVSSDVENQFLGDFYFNPVYIRPMQIYATPGLNRI